jgi:ubiquinone/menaquinone biosynthesis C-methylase UbiE
LDETNKVRKFFSHRVVKFDAYYSREKPAFWKFLDYLFRQSMHKRFVRTIEEVAKLKNPRVLDIGCGSGRYAVALARMGAASVLGIDFSQPMLSRSRKLARYGEVERICNFVCGDFLDYQFEGKFDATIAMGFFDYIKEPATHLNKIRDLTAKEAIMSFPSRWHLRNVIRKIRLSLLGCPVYFYDKVQIERLLKKSGFRDFKIEDIGRDYFVVAET